MPDSTRNNINLIHRREYEIGKVMTGIGPPKKKNGQKKYPSVKKPANEDIVMENVPVVTAKAPGIIHFLGGHCSPFAGLFLSTTINRYIQIAVSPRKDNSLRFYAVDFEEHRRVSMNNLKYRKEDRWANYIKTAIYAFIKLGCPVKGMNFTVLGNIPQQIGLASSSAIEVAAAIALQGLFHSKIADMELAQYLAKAHHWVFGRDPDLAGYITGLCGKKDQLLLIDEINFTVKKIASPFSRCKIVLIDSRVHRLGIETELAIRKEELKSALEMLSHGRMDLNLRELAEAELIESIGDLPEEIRRRILHVVQEIRRVLDAKECLLHTDLPGFSRILFHSHDSLRDLFELSCPEIDWIVKRARETDGIFGARMNGTGLGGCVYTIIKTEAVKEYKKKIEDYEKIFGFHPAIYEIKLGRL